MLHVPVHSDRRAGVGQRKTITELIQFGVVEQKTWTESVNAPVTEARWCIYIRVILTQEFNPDII